jgi:hypothetical protein
MPQSLDRLSQGMAQLLRRLQIVLQQMVSHAPRCAYPDTRQTL